MNIALLAAAAAITSSAASAVPVGAPAGRPPAAHRAARLPSPRSPRSAAVARVAQANRAALREPLGDSYVNAAQVYPWAEGAVYRLYAAPGRVSDIALEPGEGLVSVAAGDTVRWIIGDTTSGAGDTLRTHILVKPSAAGLRTNLLIMTDRRTYHLDLESTSASAMVGIAWSYPQDALIALGKTRAAAAAARPVASGIAIDALNFNYALEGDSPAWRPVRVFDDGRQVFIEFPATIATSEAPPLFATGPTGDTELLNWRQRGRYYIVDRLFSRAELRLGGRRQQVVRIVRTDARHGRGSRP